MSEEKQIEEMAKCCPFLKNGKCKGDEPIDGDCDLMCKMFGFITNLIQEGYRKQSEGEWSRFQVNCSKGYGQVYYQHKDCDFNATQLFPSPYHYCPNCGAKMKGGAE